MIGQTLTTRLEEVIDRGELDIPLLPAVAHQVIQLTMNPEFSRDELAGMLQRDQSLAGRTMRIANSAAYSPVSKLESLPQAITRLGVRTIADITLASTLDAKLFKVPGYEWRAIAIWQHSLATALWSKEIARITRSNADAIFLAGLLHSIGRPVVLQAILKLVKSLDVEPMPGLVAQMEDQYQHQVGLKICHEWKMPNLVIDTMAHLYDPGSLESGNESVMVVQAAVLFAQHMLDPDNSDEEVLRSTQVMEMLGLTGQQFDDLLEQTEALEATMTSIAS